MIIRLCVPTGPHIDDIMRRIVERWKGCTNYQTIGGWMDSHGQYASDVINVLECWVGEDVAASPEISRQTARDWFDNLASDIRDQLDESAVLYTIGPGEGRTVTATTIIGQGVAMRRTRPIGDGTGL